MKKKVAFEFFEKNQTIYFDILRLQELENRLGKSIHEIVNKGDAGINFCLAGLMCGMKHHYHKPTPLFFSEKIEQFLDEGGDLNDIAIAIIKAIFATGVFGKEAANKIAESEADKETAGKNE